MTIRYHCSSVTCPDGGRVFEEEEEFKAHLDLEHKIRCTTNGCEGLAAYCYNPGAAGSYFYCAECVDSEWERNGTLRERVSRVTRTANSDAEKLPQDHPAEQRLMGNSV